MSVCRTQTPFFFFAPVGQVDIHANNLRLLLLKRAKYTADELYEALSHVEIHHIAQHVRKWFYLPTPQAQALQVTHPSQVATLPVPPMTTAWGCDLQAASQ